MLYISFLDAAATWGFYTVNNMKLYLAAGWFTWQGCGFEGVLWLVFIDVLYMSLTMDLVGHIVFLRVQLVLIQIYIHTFL